MSCLVNVFARQARSSTVKGPPKLAPEAAGTTNGRSARGGKAGDMRRVQPQRPESDDDGGRSRASTKASSGCDSQCLAGCDRALFAQGEPSGRLGNLSPAARIGEAAPRCWALRDFNIVATLGIGFIGSVRLVKLASGRDSTPFALKIMKKSAVVKKRQVKHTKQERELLSQMDHPFIVKLLGTFQDEANLYMLMEFVNGGELFSVVRDGKRIQNDGAKFYAAEITLALGHIHSNSIAYRDLKLENVLLDSCGHAKLVDFGFAKVVRTRTYTMCGTPDYVAPEIINREGHDQCVDWWALGVLIYELLSGVTPFRGPIQAAIFQKALQAEPKYPSHFTANARSMIAGLLTKEKTRRLGAGKGDAEDVKGHPWFHSVDWDMAQRKQYKAPFLPTVSCSSDASMFFSVVEEVVPEEVLDVAPSGLSAWEQQQFMGF
jgi:protein kinase A